jgi:hypothetical protein
VAWILRRSADLLGEAAQRTGQLTTETLRQCSGCVRSSSAVALLVGLWSVAPLAEAQGVTELPPIPVTGKRWWEPNAESGLHLWSYSARSPSAFSKGGSNPSTAKIARKAGEAETDLNSCSSPSTTNPVLIATGEKHKTEVDILASGRYGLGLERTYRSRFATGNPMFGPKWTSQYDAASIVKGGGCVPLDSNFGPCYPRYLTVTLADGTRYTFNGPIGTGPFIDSDISYSVAGSSDLGTIIAEPDPPTSKTNFKYRISNAFATMTTGDALASLSDMRRSSFLSGN